MNTRPKEVAPAARISDDAKDEPPVKASGFLLCSLRFRCSARDNLPISTPSNVTGASKRTADEELTAFGKPKRQRIATAKALALLEEKAARHRKYHRTSTHSSASPQQMGTRSGNPEKTGSPKNSKQSTKSEEIDVTSLVKTPETAKATVDTSATTAGPVQRPKPVLTTQVVATPSAFRSFNEIILNDLPEGVVDFEFHRVVSRTRHSLATSALKTPAKEADESAAIVPLSQPAGPRQNRPIPKNAEVILIGSSPESTPPPAAPNNSVRPRLFASKSAAPSANSESRVNGLEVLPEKGATSTQRRNDDPKDPYTLALAQVQGKQPELCRTGIDQDFYQRVLAKKYNHILVPKLNETLSYLLWKSHAGDVKEEPYRRFFADKTASLEKKMTFLLDNIAAFCQENGRTVKFNTWKKRGRYKFNGIPVLTGCSDEWIPVEKANDPPPIRKRYRFPTGTANPRSRASLAKTQKRSQALGNLPTNPIVLDDDAGASESSPMTSNGASTESLHGPKPSRSAVSCPAAATTDDTIQSKGFIFVEHFERLCRRLGIAHPYHNKQIRSKGFTPESLAQEFVKTFPDFDSRKDEKGAIILHPEEILYNYAANIMIVHMKDTEKPRHPNQWTVRKKLAEMAPQNIELSPVGKRAMPAKAAEAAYPTPNPTEYDECSVQSIVSPAVGAPETAVEFPPPAVELPSMVAEEDIQPRPAPEVEIPPYASSNKAPRKGSRNTFAELGDGSLYEMRLQWQRAAWNSNDHLTYIAEARTDPTKRAALERQKKIALLEDRQICISSELQLLDREHREAAAVREKTGLAEESQAKDDEFLQGRIKLMEDSAATAKELEALKKLEPQQQPQQEPQPQTPHQIHMFVPGKARADPDGVYKTLMLWAQLPEEPEGEDASEKQKKRRRKRLGW
ncbi:hypothetical protein FN846DRAFT_908629 [Sphaerosporella brunnea]|uniref:Uncharacterized protein n=1 Tax=Sphaerosporella brunnea TaxID=1250544 RepID=A0A5J5ET27_9PEZI|nr:hypothetical protein FN846DRAFT_908629 [Sphaerosporella brunnea]